MIGFYNGIFTDVGNISLPITATTINRSYAAFEFFTIVNQKAFYVHRHLNRLFETLKILRIQIAYNLTELTTIIEQLIQKNPTEHISYKIFVIPEFDSSTANFKGDLFIFPVLNSKKEELPYKTGAKLLLKSYRRFLPEAKTTNYTAFIYWEQEVLQQKAVDVLYVDDDYIRETSRSNIFIVKNGIIYTPKTQVLAGITRSIVIDIIQKNTIQFELKDITITELKLADEVFITSTTREIMPISIIDTTPINQGNIGNITQFLRTQFSLLKTNY